LFSQTMSAFSVVQ